MIRTFYTFILIFISIISFSQNATIRGFVYNKDNGEPVAFSNVYLKGTTIGASTDLNGFFSINKIVAGSYTLLVTNLEFDTISEKISIKAGEILTKKFFSVKGGVMLNAVDVTAEQMPLFDTPSTTKVPLPLVTWMVSGQEKVYSHAVPPFSQPDTTTSISVPAEGS